MILSILLATALPRPSIVKLPFDCYGISANGQTLIGASSPEDGKPCIWTRKRGVRYLFKDEEKEGLTMGVSADGKVVAGRVEHAGKLWVFIAREGQEPELIAPSTSLVILLSSDGKTVAVTADQTERGIRWSKATGVQELPQKFQPACISADGSLLAGATDVGPKHKPMYTTSSIELGIEDVASTWSVSEGAVNLGRPDPWEWTAIHVCNAKGTLLAGTGKRNEIWRPFVWSAAEGFRELPVPTGMYYANVTEMTPDGKVVFGSGSPLDGNDTTLIWRVGATGAYAVTTLTEHLLRRGLDVKRWRMDYIYGASADAKLIVGSGLDPKGKYCSWLVETP
jgi:hypothetical protein